MTMQTEKSVSLDIRCNGGTIFLGQPMAMLLVQGWALELLDGGECWGSRRILQMEPVSQFKRNGTLLSVIVLSPCYYFTFFRLTI